MNRHATIILSLALFLSFNVSNLAYSATQALAPKMLGIDSIEELDGAMACLGPDPTMNDLVVSYFKKNGMSLEKILVPKALIATKFIEGHCDVIFLNEDEISAFMKKLDTMGGGGKFEVLSGSIE